MSALLDDEAARASRYRANSLAAMLRRSVVTTDAQGRPHAKTPHVLADLTFTQAVELYQRTDRSHFWSTKGLCTRCRTVIFDGAMSQLACPMKREEPDVPNGRSNVCPLLLALAAYYDTAIARARFQVQHGRWPEPGEEIIHWTPLMALSRE